MRDYWKAAPTEEASDREYRDPSEGHDHDAAEVCTRECRGWEAVQAAKRAASPGPTIWTTGDPTERRATVVRDGLCWYVMRYIGPRVLHAHWYWTPWTARRAARRHEDGGDRG